LDCINGKRLSTELNEAARETYGQSDVLLLLGTRAWGTLWREYRKGFSKNLMPEDDAQAQATAQALDRLVGGARFALSGVQLDEGLAISVSALFDEDPKITEFLTTFRGGRAACDLNALPTGRVVAAFAARGEGSQNVILARSLLRLGLAFAMSSEGESYVTERAELVAAFGNIWQQLNGSRLAIYRTAAPDRHGLLCLLLILDPDDPQRFVDGVAPLAERLNTTLARWATRAGLPPFSAVYRPESRQLDNRRVGELEIQIDGPDTELPNRMKQLLGPNWNRLTVGVEGKHVVVMAGSDIDVFREALANIAQKEPGLAGQAALRSSHRQLHPGRKVEVHFSMVEGIQLRDVMENKRAPRAGDPCRELTSVALTVHDQGVQMDVWLPVCDLRAAARESGWVSD
jgi:hypothetical protein